MMSLIIGGSGSGKSEYAESRICAIAVDGKKYYLAAMQVYGEEGKRRVERHRKLRAGKGFLTIEQPVSADLALQYIDELESASVLLECMTNLAANEMFMESGIRPEKEVVKKITDEITNLHAQVKNLVIVTGNVFEDGIRYDEGTMAYIAALGTINRRLAEMADEVVEVVAGIPLLLKEMS